VGLGSLVAVVDTFHAELVSRGAETLCTRVSAVDHFVSFSAHHAPEVLFLDRVIRGSIHGLRLTARSGIPGHQGGTALPSLT
jgi:hypothetical protein